jgi:ZIP family zinc transporter
MPWENIVFAFGLTILAGLATGVGSALAFFAKRLDRRFLAVSLGFSAGVMIYISLVEMFVQAKGHLVSAHGERAGSWLTALAFFAGFALIGLIDKLVPSFENPHELREVGDAPAGASGQKALLRMGLFSALAIAVHNLPEGLATFIGGLQDPKLGVSIAVAIAIHNIPEGIAVSVPIYYATGSRKKAFGLSFLSGLSEPVGALIGYFLLRAFVGETMFGIVFGLVAGIMVYISLDELLPAAERYGEHHLAIYGLSAGMAVMAVSLLMFL